MDIEVIIAIIIWILISAYSYYSSKKEKGDKAKNAASVMTERRVKSIAIPQPFNDTSTTSKPVEKVEAKPAQTPLFNEGQRITASKPMAIYQNPATRHRGMKRPADREQLRRAIIWGEILKPKFDNP